MKKFKVLRWEHSEVTFFLYANDADEADEFARQKHDGFKSKKLLRHIISEERKITETDGLEVTEIEDPAPKEIPCELG